MAKSSKSGRRMVSRHIKRHKRKGMGQKQAVAAALSEARRKGKKVPPRRGAKKGGRKAGGRKKGGRKGGRKKR